MDFAGTFHQISFTNVSFTNVGTYIYGAPTLGENVGTQLLAKREEIGSKITEENEKVCVKAHRSFFLCA